MRTTRRLLALLLAVPAVWVLAACTPGGRTTTPSPSPTLETSVAAFQTLSGLTVPATAKSVTVREVSDPSGVPAYRVDFTLPSAGVDDFCTSGHMQLPFDINTVPPDIREQFGYDGDGAGGVKVAEGALPSRITVQRTVFATGTDTPSAVVRVYAYEQAR